MHSSARSGHHSPHPWMDGSSGPAMSEPRAEGEGRVEWWAHQDSNLGQAGYEPAALTAELWARWSVQHEVPGAGFQGFRVRFEVPGSVRSSRFANREP